LVQVVVVLVIGHVDQVVPTLFSQLLHLQVVAVVVLVAVQDLCLDFQEVLVAVVAQP
jgi:hypothetical protein